MLVWDLTTGKRLRRRDYPIEVREIKEDNIRGLPPRGTAHAAFAPDGEVVSAWRGNAVGLAEVSRRRWLAVLPKGVGAPLVFSPDGRLVAAAVLRPKYKGTPY